MNFKNCIPAPLHDLAWAVWWCLASSPRQADALLALLELMQCSWVHYAEGIMAYLCYLDERSVFCRLHLFLHGAPILPLLLLPLKAEIVGSWGGPVCLVIPAIDKRIRTDSLNHNFHVDSVKKNTCMWNIASFLAIVLIFSVFIIFWPT